MKVFAAVVALLLAFSGMSMAEDLNSATSSGLTGVTYTTTNVGGLIWFDFTVTNNTNNSSPLIDDNDNSYVVLIDKLTLFPGAAAVGYATPDSSWSYTQGNGFERYSDTPNNKYDAPPSIAPMGSITGFKLAFNQGFVLPDDCAITHVLAVVPNLSSTLPVEYDGLTVTFEDIKGSTFTGPTWFDKPRTKIPPLEVVPETSTVVLGLLGFLSTGGLARLRRRA